MKFFEVQFETIGWVDGRPNVKKLTGDGLSTSFLDGFNQQMASESGFPSSVLKVKGAYITEEEGNVHYTDNSDMKVFVVITLLLNAASETAADNFTPPCDLLSQLSDIVGTVDNTLLLRLDDCWEVANTEEIDETAVSDQPVAYL